MEDNKPWLRRLMLDHPLACVLLVAIVLRIPAIIYSKGYMASDDHFETVQIAYRWLQTSPLNTEGHLTWNEHASSEISRFPLYTLGLYGVMRVYQAAGITSLDTIMYGVRALHALLSLLVVWAMFRIAGLVTRSTKWAVIAGMVGAAHFAMPYLSVRTLIEVVSGELWIVAVYALYLFFDRKAEKWLVAAGILTGLAWIIRFQIATAALPIPFVLWYSQKQLRPALVYCAAGAVMVLLAGMVDWLLLGSFLASFINHIQQISTEGEVYHTPRLVYFILLAALLVPPLSVVGLYLAGKKSFWSKHVILVTSVVSFLIFHTMATSRQERYIIPILPAALLMMVLALEQHFRSGVRPVRASVLWKWILVPALALNFAVLFPLTVSYSHRGLVAPIVQIGQMSPGAHVLFVSPERRRLYPISYGGYQPLRPSYVSDWQSRDFLPISKAIWGEFDYLVLYPLDSASVGPYLGALAEYTAKVEPWGTVSPSPLDDLLHLVNPDHNQTHHAYIFKRIADSAVAASNATTAPANP